MPYIRLEEHLPGITGLLEYRKDSAAPIRALTQLLLRGPSTLSEGERELMATVVSHGNNCQFCCNAHTAIAGVLLDDPGIAEKVWQFPFYFLSRIRDRVGGDLALEKDTEMGTGAVATDNNLLIE